MSCGRLAALARARLRSAAMAILAATLVSACATAQPGLQADAVLVDPSRAELAALAARLRQPRLAPIELDFSRPLTPRELAVIAVVASPELKALRAKAAVADAQVFSAGLLPDPVLNAAYAKNLGGADIYDGVSGAIVYELVALRQRSTVLAGQRAAAEQSHLDLAWQELQVAAQAELLAARITGLAEITAYNARSLAVARFALDRALKASARGDIRADEVETRRIVSADFSNAARITEISLGAARYDLNKLLGLSPETRLIIAAAGPPSITPTQLDPQALFDQARAERLDLQALQAGYRSQNAAVRKAMMDAFPSLLLTLGGGEDTTHTKTFDPAVSFTLPLWNRNRGGIAIAQATQAQLRAEYASRLFATRADIAELIAQLRIETAQKDEIIRQIAPVRAIVSATEIAAARGDIARATAETARQTLLDKEAALAALDQSMAEQRVTLKLAVGGPLLD